MPPRSMSSITYHVPLLLPVLNQSVSFFFLMIRPPPISTLFPYTTLFRSNSQPVVRAAGTLRALAALHLAQSRRGPAHRPRSEEHTSELQSRQYLVCRLLLEKNKLFLYGGEGAVPDVVTAEMQDGVLHQQL